MADILSGLELLFQPSVFPWLVIGLVAGFIVGVLPGFDAANGAALVLPFAIGLPTESAIILIMAIYAGSQTGGSVPAILLNLPGTAGSAITAIDGNMLAKHGHAQLALGVARVASVIGGVIGGIVVLFVIGPMGEYALLFRSPEMLLLALVGLVLAGSIIGDNPLKGLISTVLGLLIAAMAASPRTGEPRFTFGFPELYESVPFIPALIGLFAFSQLFMLAAGRANLTTQVSISRARTGTRTARAVGGARELAKDSLRGMGASWRFRTTAFRSAAIGLGIGAVPGLGTSVANLVSYGQARRRSKEPEMFGKGSIEGVVAAEACDNAVVSGTLVPTLALGIPGSGLSVILLAALTLQGIQPGPRVLVTEGPAVYAAILSIIIGSLLLLPIGVLLATPLTFLLRVPVATITPILMVLSVIGAYALRNSLFDVVLAIVFGLVAVLMMVHGYPIVPLVLGLVLGPIVEANFFRSLDISGGSFDVFVGTPTAVVLLVGLIVTFLVTLFRALPAAWKRGALSPFRRHTNDHNQDVLEH
jgi:putative tricarboxylic transport membrane protein